MLLPLSGSPAPSPRIPEGNLSPAEVPPGRADLERWAWMLLLLDASERAGLTPIDTPRLHRLAYFANCLAPVYDLPVADGKIMKFVRGPYYPDFQWDIDRLVAMGLMSLRTFEPFEDVHGWWFSASYVVPPTALEHIPFIRESPRLARIHDFQVELASAFADMPDEVQMTSGERDATYADPTVPEGALIDFAEWTTRQQNYSNQAAQAVSNYSPLGLRLLARDRIHLYFRYLQRVEPIAPAGGTDLQRERAAR